MTTERALPANVEAERMILGVVILNNSAMDQAAELVGVDDFSSWSNRQIFRAMLKLYAEPRAIDPLSLQDLLTQAGALDKIGGPGHIASLFDGVPRFSNIENYCRLVKEASVRRKQIQLGHWLMNAAWDDGADGGEVTRLLNVKLDELLNAQVTHELVSGAVAVDRTLGRLEKTWDSPSQTLGLKTGYPALDKTIYGLRPRLHILAAPPKVGKTTLGLNLVHNVIQKNTIGDNKPVPLVISLEMSVDELSERALAAFAKVSLDKLLTGELSEADKAKVRLARDEIAAMPIEYLEGFEAVTPATMKALIRKVKRIHGRVDLLLVDYIQLCDADGNTQNDTARITQVTRELKRISHAFNIPVIGLSQVNRKFADRSEDKQRLRLTDLRQSGSLEQDADVIMFVQREDQNDLGDTRRILNIAAQRGGKSDVDIPMVFFGDRSRFEETTWDLYRSQKPEGEREKSGNGKGKPKKQAARAQAAEFLEESGW